ncbi:MAG: hypothetical protein J6O73_07595 [Lachnospiraceae bacterium]|nr:hypothetical protein [Lachnospiraceae bacterium]
MKKLIFGIIVLGIISYAILFAWGMIDPEGLQKHLDQIKEEKEREAEEYREKNYCSNSTMNSIILRYNEGKPDELITHGQVIDEGSIVSVHMSNADFKFRKYTYDSDTGYYYVEYTCSIVSNQFESDQEFMNSVRPYVRCLYKLSEAEIDEYYEAFAQNKTTYSLNFYGGEGKITRRIDWTWRE